MCRNVCVSASALDVEGNMLQGNIPQSVSQLINLEYVFPTRRDGAVLVRGGNHAVVRQRCLSVNVTPMPVFQVSRRRLQPNERAHSRRRPLPQRTAVWQHLAPDGSLQFLFQQLQYTHRGPVRRVFPCVQKRGLGRQQVYGAGAGGHVLANPPPVRGRLLENVHAALS